MIQDLEIFVDSDGVIADMNGYSKTVLGRTIEEFQPKGKFWSAMQHHDKTVSKWFRSLPKMSDADALMSFLFGNFAHVKILTASGHVPHDVKEQKIEWYAEHYPNVECIVVRKSPDKAEYAHPKSVLIDDRSKSIDPWRAAGGIGILHTSAEDTILQLRTIAGLVEGL